MKISTASRARKPAAPKKNTKTRKPQAKAKAKTPAKKNGGYIAPRVPVSSGGEGASVSTYTPVYRPVSSGGESGGGGGYSYGTGNGYPYAGGGISYGGE